jgi:hypothetical protein
MSSHNREPMIIAENELASLCRSIMSGGSRSVAELKRFPRVCRVLEHRLRNLLSARVTLTPEGGRILGTHESGRRFLNVE